jgi:hypothetical protein
MWSGEGGDGCRADGSLVEPRRCAGSRRIRSVTFARRAAASSVLSCGQAALPAMAWATSLSIVEFARLAGHSPEECLRTYAHTF